MNDSFKDSNRELEFAVNFVLTEMDIFTCFEHSLVVKLMLMSILQGFMG